MRDIGRAEDGTKEQRSLARLNGVPTVTLEIRRSPAPTPSRSSKRRQAKLARVAAQLPADVKIEVIRDQSRYIYAALHEINLHLVLGSILACLVVLAFMRSWRSTIIAAVAIPASVISTFGMMWALELHAQQRDHAGAGADGRRRDRRRHRRARKIFRFIEEKKHDAIRSGARGDRGDRAGGAWRRRFRWS